MRLRHARRRPAAAGTAQEVSWCRRPVRRHPGVALARGEIFCGRGAPRGLAPPPLAARLALPSALRVNAVCALSFHGQGKPPSAQHDHCTRGPGASSTTCVPFLCVPEPAPRRNINRAAAHPTPGFRSVAHLSLPSRHCTGPVSGSPPHWSRPCSPSTFAQAAETIHA